MTKLITRIFAVLAAMVLASTALHAQDVKDLFITGNATPYGWVYSNPEASRLIKQADGTYMWAGKLTKGNNFRFLVEKKWYPTYTTVEGSGKTFEPGTYKIQYDAEKRAGEPAFGVAVGGEYTIIVNPEALEMTMRLDKADQTQDDVHIYLTGGATPAGWSTGGAIELTKTAPGKYTWTGDLNTNSDSRFRFLTSRNWYPTYTTAEGEHQSVTEGKYRLQYDATSRKGEPSFKIEIPGNYTINLDIEALEMEMIINNAVEVKKMYILGNAFAEDASDSCIEMQLCGNNIYEWTGELFPTTADGTATVFKFTPDPAGSLTYTCRTDVPGDEPVNPGDTYDLFEKNDGDDACDNYFCISDYGRYTITVDTRLMTMSVSLIKPELYIVGAAVTGGNTPWALNDNYLARMKETEPMVFEWTGFLHAKAQNGDPGRFKFLRSNSSWNGYVSTAPQHIVIEAGAEYPIVDSTKPGSGDNQFIVPADGVYHLKVDTRALTFAFDMGDYDALFLPVGAAGTAYVSGHTLNIEATGIADIAVCDITGRVIAALQAAEAAIDLPSSGLYIVRINEKIAKFVVK